MSATFVQTETRRQETSSGERVEVTVSPGRQGLALYIHGTGPFYTNRAARRQRPSGYERRAAMIRAQRRHLRESRNR